MTVFEEQPQVDAGRADFDGLAILHDASVLTPRPWTVAQSRWAAFVATQLPPGPMLELCAGVGHIGLAAAVAAERALVQVDLSPRACAFAVLNAAAAGVPADVRCAALDEALAPGERFPLILADPPWVPTADIGQHPDDPELAVDGGADGLDLARTCLAVAARHLADGGRLLLQLRDLEQVVALAVQLPAWGLVGLDAQDHRPGGALLLAGRAG